MKPPEQCHFQKFSPPQYGWGRLFIRKWFRRGPLRAGHGIPSPAILRTFLRKKGVQGDSVSEGREWGVGSVVVESAFLGCPDFQSRGPKAPSYFEGFRSDMGQESGAPQTQIQRPRIQCPILGPLSVYKYEKPRNGIRTVTMANYYAIANALQVVNLLRA